MNLKEVAKREKVSERMMFTVVNVLKDCPVKIWRGYEFQKDGRQWEASAIDSSAITTVSELSDSSESSAISYISEDDELPPLERAKRARQNARPATSLL